MHVAMAMDLEYVPFVPVTGSESIELGQNNTKGG